MGIEIWAFRKLIDNIDHIRGSDVLTLGRQGMHLIGDPYNKDNLVAEHLLSRGIQPPPDNVLKGYYSEQFFLWLGASTVMSMDFSDYEGASIIHDLNLPIPNKLKDQYNFIFDGGTLEHVFNFPRAILSCIEMLKIGGVFLSVSVANNFLGHGFYQFSPELMWRIFGPNNGFNNQSVSLTFGNDVITDVVDPNISGVRQELGCTSTPNYIITIAEKTHNNSLKVLQSDYLKIWGNM
ncbi:MAG TPA: hypothetical protein DCE78_07435 [Bacteroidetes bacterium]|nr:hypothetical protein [Bacteroidota bacterium]